MMQHTTKHVLITGASGSVGTKLFLHLSRNANYRVRGIDKRMAPEISPLMVADLAADDNAWEEQLGGVDVVVHLAGNPRISTPWDGVVHDNIDVTLKLYLACARHGIKKVVLASSVWTMGGYRFAGNQITPDTAPLPPNAYGAGKIFAERLGKGFYDALGITTVALRLGACLRGDNRPSEEMVRGDWQQSHWLSDRDMCQAFERAIDFAESGFRIFHVASNVHGSRWDIGETRRDLNYDPVDAHTVKVSPKRQLQATVARLAFDILPRTLHRIIPRKW